MSIISAAGGAFIVLVFVHFVADWMLQTDTMARRKADESPWLLIVHSTVYALSFCPILFLSFKGSFPLIVSATLSLLISHGAIDTYTPIWLWARVIRRPQEMDNDPVDGFILWSSKPYGMFLTSGIDQLMHAAFLAPIAVMIAVSDAKIARIIGLGNLGAALGLAALSVATVFVWNKREVKGEPDDDYRPEFPSQHD